MAASGEAKTAGTSAITLPVPTMAAAGIVNTTVTGTSGITILMPTMAASGSAGVKTVTGTSAITIPIPTMGAASFAGVTTQTAICRPTEVPHEVVLGTYKLGALAYHRDGIASVKFKWTDSLAATATTTVTARSNLLKHPNAIWCYNTSFDTTAMADGAVTVEITAVPNTGSDRVISYTFLNNSAGSFGFQFRVVSPNGNDDFDGLSTAFPVRTIHAALRSLAAADSSSDCGGHFVLLMAGTHVDGLNTTPDPTSSRAWVTIRPYPGESKSTVTISAQANSWRNLQHVKFENLTLSNTTVEADSTSGTPNVWFHDCDLIGPGPTVSGFRWSNGWTNTYFSFSLLRNVAVAAHGAAMVRDCVLFFVGDDFIASSKGAIINTTGVFQRQASVSFLPDGYKLSTTATQNVVVCGLRLTDAQDVQLLTFGFGGGTYKDIAIENAMLVVDTASEPTAMSSELHSQNTHVLLRHVTITGQKFLLKTSPTFDYIADACEISNCCFYDLQIGDSTKVDDLAEMLVRTCHYEVGNSHNAIFGSSTGDAKFTASGTPSWDYRPAATSPLLLNGTALDQPPGPKGVGTSATPNIGAWGDAAGLGFSINGYVAAPANVVGECHIGLPLPTMTSSGAMSDLVARNLPYLEENMLWEGVKILKGWAEMTPPPGSPVDHFFGTRFYTKGDGRSVRLIMRVDGALDHIDFWFFHYWGHTGTSQVTWPKASTPGPITIDSQPFFAWGEGRPVRVANWFATGHGMVDRVRLNLTAFQVWTTGKVSNSTNTDPLLPFDAHPTAPSWTTDKAKTLWNEIFAAKGTQSSMQKPYTGDDREQFRENEWCLAFPGRTGDQERFGINHLGVDVWAGGDAREEAWWMVLRKHMNQLGNFVHPVSGDVVDFLESRYDGLVMHQDGIRTDSNGWNNDPAKGQNWFNHKTVSEFSWMSKDPVSGQRWFTFNQQHWAVNHLCQYYDRHKDPAVYQMILHAQSRWIASWPIVNKGPTLHNPGAHRARGRGMQAAACMYLITQDAQLLTQIKGRLEIELTEHASEIAQHGVPYPSNGQSWESAIHATGLMAVTIPSITLGSPLQENVETMLQTIAEWVLLTWHEYPVSSGNWTIPYQVETNGTARAGQENFSGRVWALAPIQWLYYHKLGSLTSAQQTKVQNIITDRVTNQTGDANVWPEDWEFHYAPLQIGPKTGTSAITIPLPSASADGFVKPVTKTVVGIFASSLPVPVVASSGTSAKNGTSAITLPLPTMSAVGTSRAPSVTIVGSVIMTLPVPTMVATGAIHVTGVFEASLPLPTTSGTGTVLFQAHAEAQYAGDDTTTTFLIPYGYLSVDHLAVTVDGTTFEIGSADLTINDAGDNVTFTVAPASGTTISIQRATPHPELDVEFADGAPVLPSGLNRAILQAIYYSEEVADQV
jgi:hypothetical protein